MANQYPVKVHHRKANGEYYTLDGWAISTSIANIGEFSFPSTMTEAEQKAEVQRQYAAWKATLTRDADGDLMVPADAYDPCSLDEAATEQYSKEESRPAAAVGGEVRAVLHRPLRHIRPWIFCDMMNVDSLAPEGFEVPDGKNCVVHQLEILVSRNGNLTWTRERVEI